MQSLGYHNLKPNQTSLDATPRLNAAISYVITNAACHKLTVDSGTYYFRSLAAGGNAYLVLQETHQDAAKDFDFQNASFIFKESFFPQSTSPVVKNAVSATSGSTMYISPSRS